MPPQVFMPGYEGLPFRGQAAPNLKNDDERQPIEILDAKVGVFDLTKDEDLREYARIWDMIGKGKYLCSAEDRQYDEKISGWRVFLRYAQRYAEMPGALDKRITHDSSGLRITG